MLSALFWSMEALRKANLLPILPVFSLTSLCLQINLSQMVHKKLERRGNR